VRGTPGDRELEVGQEQPGVDRLATDVALHQRLVLGLLDDALDECGSLGVVAVVPGDQADETPSVPEVDRQDPLAEGLSRLRHDAVDVGAGVVDLGDDDHPGHGHGGALTPERPRLLVDPLVGGDDEQRAVRGPEARSHLPHEVDVPGGVQQVDLHAVVHQRREREPDGASLTVLDLLEVTHGRAVLDGAGPVQHSGRHQQPLDQGGLPRTRRTHDQDVADGLRSGRDRGTGLGGTTAGLPAHRGGSRSLVRRSENSQPTVARSAPRGKGHSGPTSRPARRR
jgi:hypothetical protein